MKSNLKTKNLEPARSTPRKKKAAAPRWNNLVKTPDEQYELKRQAVVAEASRAFGHHGYQHVSLDDIAKSLNVTKPALYHYIKSKQELLYECHNLSLDIGEQVIRNASAYKANGLEKLKSFMFDYIEAATRELGSSAVLHELNAMRPGDRKRIMQRRRKVDLQLRNLIEEGIADKSIAPCNPKLAVFWFMGAVNGISLWFRADGELTGTQIAQAFVDFLVTGIQAQR